jgi:molybdate transport system ATP-binding protein
LEVDGVIRRLASGRPQRSAEEHFELEVAFGVEPGQTLALVGPNGAGKSTVLSAIGGLIPLTDGHIRLGPRLLDAASQGRWVPPEERNIGIVFQDYLLFDHLSVRDNVAFGLRSRGVGRRQAAAEAERWLDQVGLAAMADRRPDRLSGGQAQRVALARALAADPDLLLLDEPLAALDITTSGVVRRLLAHHLDHFAGPRVLVSHDPVDAMALADRICVLEQGRVSQIDTPDVLRRRPATAYIAALAGLNLLAGRGDGDGNITVDGSDVVLRTSQPHPGPVRAVIDPRAVSLYPSRPDGSPRNTWAAVVEWIEPLGTTCRIGLGGPLSLMVDITPAAAESLGLAPGSSVWASVKATEISVEGAPTDSGSTGAVAAAEG